MKTLPWMGALALLLTACDPLVELDDTTGSDSTTAASDDAGGSGGPGSVPPNSTSPVTTSPVTTSPTTGGGCVPGTFESCACPNGYPGDQECGPSGTYLPCECDDFASTSGWDSWGSSGWGSSGWWGSSSTGGWNDSPIPDLPPGETCLPLDLPCEGSFDVTTDAELEQLSTCSHVAGDLFLYTGITNLEPLSCLRQVDAGFVIVDTQLVSVDGLGLESAEFVGIGDNPQLTFFEAPNLQVLDALYLINNDNLDTVALPQLSSLNLLEALGNDLLPDCVTVELFEQTGASTLNCGDNLEDKCTPVCG